MPPKLLADTKSGAVNVAIVHGYMASKDDHWFPWLRAELKARGINVKVISLPNPSSPKPEEWQETLSTELGNLNNNSIIVAHSLGCIAILNYLNSLENSKHLAGLLLVSGFVSKIPNLPQLDNFIYDNLDFDKLRLVAEKRLVIGSPQDSIVPFYLTEDLAHKLQTKLLSIPDSGHFLASDGYRKFPQVLAVINDIFKPQTSQ